MVGGQAKPTSRFFPPSSHHRYHHCPAGRRSSFVLAVQDGRERRTELFTQLAGAGAITEDDLNRALLQLLQAEIGTVTRKVKPEERNKKKEKKEGRKGKGG
jgi:hypothetical protein